MWMILWPIFSNTGLKYNKSENTNKLDVFCRSNAYQENQSSISLLLQLIGDFNNI